MSAAPQLDEARMRALLETLTAALGQHYLTGPPDRMKVFEALNALGFTVAVTLTGTADMLDENREWFESVVDRTIADLRAKV